jgi:hypothetical protein
MQIKYGAETDAHNDFTLSNPSADDRSPRVSPFPSIEALSYRFLRRMCHLAVHIAPVS